MDKRTIELMDMNKAVLKAHNILWDVDDEDDNEDFDLPEEVNIPLEEFENTWDEDDVSDYISDEVGFCHCGFELTAVMDRNEIQNRITEINEMIAKLEKEANCLGNLLEIVNAN